MSDQAVNTAAAAADSVAQGQDAGAEIKSQGQSDQGGSADPGQMTKEQAREAIRRHKLKVDGQEIEVDEDELKRGYSHQRAANKRMQEAIQKEKASQKMLEMMRDKQGLLKAMQAFGHDPRKLAEELLAEALEEESLDPKERELRMTKKQLEEYTRKEKEREEAAKKAKEDELKSHFAQKFTEEFTKALETVKVPKTKETVQKMAFYVGKYAKKGVQITAEDAAKLVQQDIENTHKSVYQETDAETLVRLLGEDGIKKIREYETAKLKDPNANLKTPQDQRDPGVRSNRAPGKRMSISEWRQFNRK